MDKNKNVQFCSRTHIGKVKRNNQDFLEINQEHQLAAVADGIGGKVFGEVASRLAVEACMEYLNGFDTKDLQQSSPHEIGNAIKYANEALITVQRNEPKFSDMGSTLSCFWIDDMQVHYAWVGDSRIYRIQPSQGMITMLSEDHTLDQSKINADLAPELHQRASSILTQMVGSILLLKSDTGTANIQQGDIIIACTDGLSDRVTDELLLEYAITFSNDHEAYADKLLDRALDCGGQDNISFIIAQVSA